MLLRIRVKGGMGRQWCDIDFACVWIFVLEGHCELLQKFSPIVGVNLHLFGMM